MRSDATAVLQVLPSPKVSGEGLNLRRSPPAPIQGGEPAPHPAQSSSSSSLSARSRPVCESTDILFVSPFMDPVTSIYLPLREMTTFDHPSVCNFSNTCSAVTGRSPAMKAGAGACCAFAIIKPTLPASNAPRITHPMSRIMSLSFVAHAPSTGGAKRPAFKAKLNPGLCRSHLGEIGIHRERAPSYRACRRSTAAPDGLAHSCKFAAPQKGVPPLCF